MQKGCWWLGVIKKVFLWFHFCSVVQSPFGVLCQKATRMSDTKGFKSPQSPWAYFLVSGHPNNVQEAMLTNVQLHMTLLAVPAYRLKVWGSAETHRLREDRAADARSVVQTERRPACDVVGSEARDGVLSGQAPEFHSRRSRVPGHDQEHVLLFSTRL